MTRLHPARALRAGGIAALITATLCSDNNSAPLSALVQLFLSVGALTAALIMGAQVIRYMRAR